MTDRVSTVSTTDLAARIAPGDGVVVHQRPLTVVATTGGDVAPLAESLTAMVESLIESGELDFGPVAAGLQRCVVEHQPTGVAAILDISPDPIAFLFDQALASGPGATHRASGRSGWTTVFVEDDRLHLAAGPGIDLPVAGWSRLRGGTVAGVGAHVSLVRSLTGISEAASATEELVTRSATVRSAVETEAETDEAAEAPAASAEASDVADTAASSPVETADDEDQTNALNGGERRVEPDRRGDRRCGGRADGRRSDRPRRPDRVRRRPGRPRGVRRRGRG